MSGFKIGVCIKWNWQDSAALDAAGYAESLGFDRIWTNGHATSRDQLVFLACASLMTKRIDLGTAIIDPFARHPVAIAASAATVSSLTRRDLILGIGSSQPRIFSKIGIDYARPVEKCKEAVIIIKKLLEGGAVEFAGRTFKVSGSVISTLPKSRTSVLIGAEGPKFVQMAGECADGIIFPIVTDGYNDDTVRTFLQGWRASGRKLEDAQIVGGTYVRISHSKDKALQEIKPQIAEAIIHLKPTSFKYLGITVEEAEAYKGNPQVMPDRIADELSICGDVEYCIKRILKLKRLGLSEVYIHPPSPLDRNSVGENFSLISEELIPELREQTDE